MGKYCLAGKGWYEISRTSFRSFVILYTKRFHRTASKVGAERKQLSITPFWLLKGRLFIVSSKSDGKDNWGNSTIRVYIRTCIQRSFLHVILRSFLSLRCFDDDRLSYTCFSIQTNIYIYIYCFLNKARRHFVIFSNYSIIAFSSIAIVKWI